MKNLLVRRASCLARPLSGRSSTGAAKARLNPLLVAVPVLLFALTTVAKADSSYSFSISGSGFSSSGVLDVASTGPLPGAYTITGISGTFSDSTYPFSGAITNLDFAPPPTFNLSPPAAPNTFGAPAFTSAGFSYDNLFWPGGNSAAVCDGAPPAFAGGDLDIYGIAFDVAGGYTVNLWSNGGLGGYQLDDSKGTTRLHPDNMGFADPVSFSVAPTPEPASLWLMGTGLSGLMIVVRRKKLA